MPEVISLLSSTPPPPADLPPSHQPPRNRNSSSPYHSHSQRIPAPPIFNSFLSSDLDTPLFTHDDLAHLDLDQPPKRRRLSNEPSSDPEPASRPRRRSKSKSKSRSKSPGNSPVHFSPNPLFLFSDEDILPSDVVLSDGPGPGPEPETSNPQPWNSESDAIVFTSSVPEPVHRGGVNGVRAEARTEAITIDDYDNDDIGDNDDDNGYAVFGRRSGRDEIEGFSDELVMPDLNELLDRSAGLGAGSGSGTGIGTGSRTTHPLRPSRPAPANPQLSSRTANLLASLDRSNSELGTSSTGTGRRAKGRNDDSDLDILDELDEPRKPARKKATTKLTSEEKETRAREREAAKAQREQNKEKEKERKQKLKEEKAHEKQLAADLSEVNKLKVDKKESTPEMIVDLAGGMEGTSVGNQTAEFMHRLGVEMTFFSSSISNVVKWRRKVTASYNESAGYWEPCARHIRDEDQVLVLVTAQEFVDMVITPDIEVDLDTHVQLLKTAYPGRKPIYLIEGLTAWMRKNQNSRNRAYQAEVRRQLEQETNPPSSSQPTTTTTRRKKTTNKPESTPPVDNDTIEDALLQLQVTHSCLIHHTNAAPESAEWIKNFTELVSTVPYRRERMDGYDAAFCMDHGQVKPGDNKTDTYVKMLQEVNRVTASMAYGIAERYPSVMDLVSGMRIHGPAMLEDVKKSANKNGALTDSRIGPAASKRLYKVFMGLDPTSTDV